MKLKKSHVSWAKEKAKELKCKESDISFGETHATFITEKNKDKFSAKQIKYPKSLFEKIVSFTIKIISIILFGLFGAGIGFIFCGIFLEDNIIFVSIGIGFFLGCLWKIWEMIRFDEFKD